ncbi:MAG: polymerase alpha subunit [Clostridiales bacterium]|nr:polymerase alpha subunit [Clostridiales bacterium]
MVKGQIISIEQRELRKTDKILVTLGLTDFTDSIMVKMFVLPADIELLMEDVKKGSFIKVKGAAQYDSFAKEIVIMLRGLKLSTDFTTKRIDTMEVKRVELHAHTKMSDMDATIEPQDLVKQAKRWGHKAVAITDHGVVQAFPDANHALDKGDDFKIIYGVEAYLVDDVVELVKNPKGQTFEDTFVVFDIETTGFSAISDEIIEIGAVKIQGGKEVARYSQFVNPNRPIPYKIEMLTGINDEMVVNAPHIDHVLPGFLEFCEGAVLVAHNARFDTGFIFERAKRFGIATNFTILDTVTIARKLLPELSRYKLKTVANHLGVSLENAHRAVDDAKATADIFLIFISRLKLKEINTLADLSKLDKVSPEEIMKMPMYHAIILVKNQIGLKNLYKLISYSHIDYFKKRPRMPKSLIEEHREGLILGSACEAGELYQAILNELPRDAVMRLAEYYDYYEIQPIENNSFMLREDKTRVKTEEDLKEINRAIVKLGEEYNKPVVATCDVHFMDKEDEIFRRLIMAGQKFKDADQQPPLYFRNTEEMLNEFMYLGEDKAEEVVITNTNLIADMIEKISPVQKDKYPPRIENSDETLRTICYEKAHSLYGANLPQQVSERLERELHSIITNGFAVMYIIAQKLVWKSLEDGYLVGSRGSVGSSFAATMAGITEVNPLSAHYYCPNCHYSDFESEFVMSYSGRSGCDMPDKECPECGCKLNKEGHDIPFETFLGFKGDKEPDIDLNFSGEYQSKAHEYTEEIFGKGYAFRAGTIGTLAEKTAYGYVKNYYEEKGVPKRDAEISRLVSGCTGVRRTTGQHPGGIIVLPRDQEIYNFTPIQKPANDMETKTITTHFDYHSIDHNLLKLDILGHDDPTMIKMLEDLTGLNATLLPMDDEKVMSLFKSPKALGVTAEDLGGYTLGALGIPEFGTDFVMQMLIDTKPESFSDLVRISGLSHGTDVWLGNAQTLIQEGKADIRGIICTRDDIMTYLIHMGVDKSLSFTIMESVRKGKGLKADWEDAMYNANVPEWYIWSCKKIKYMFPKAHAVAYVMMAIRIAYFKVYYPKEYYTTFFSIRASAFNYETMCLGKERLEYHMAEVKKIMEAPTYKPTAKDKDTIKDMKIVQEMYARGIEFMPIDIYTANANRFQIIDGKIMPALSTIDGLGEKAAEGVVEAAKGAKFLSVEDFKNRTKVSTTVIDSMKQLGLLPGLPDANQMSLFDFM